MSSVPAIVWLLIAAALVLAYIKGGPSGISAWLKAKFIGTGA
jgi:hypothetical protein